MKNLSYEFSDNQKLKDQRSKIKDQRSKNKVCLLLVTFNAYNMGIGVMATIKIAQKLSRICRGLNFSYIRAKRANTVFAWINSIFLVMSLLILVMIFLALNKGRFGHWLTTITIAWAMIVLNLRTGSLGLAT